MRRFLLPILCLLFTAPAWAGNGLITKQSAHDVGTTIDRLEAALEEKGLTIFARVNHSAGAAGVDLQLRPTELLIFGNPKAGTPLMQSDQRMGIDLPQKALAWRDAEGNVWLSYNDPAYLARRHTITDRDPLLDKIGGLLKAMTDKATR